MERRLTMPVTSTKKRLSATVYYLLSGLALAWPGLLATGWLLPDWRTGLTLTPLSLSAIHLLVLGFMLTVAFGVLYQIVPIAFQAPPVPRHVLYWHLPLHILSVVLMVTGFLTLRFPVVGTGGTLLIGVSIAYFTLIVRSYVRAKNKTLVHRNLVWPLLSMWLVLLIGVYQALFPGYTDQRVVLSHVLLGGVCVLGRSRPCLLVQARAHVCHQPRLPRVAAADSEYILQRYPVGHREFVVGAIQCEQGAA
jgi:hypothetical protein